MYHRWRSYDVWFLRYKVRQKVYCHSGPFFTLEPSDLPEKSKFCKNEKKAQKYYHFTFGYHKWQSYDVWFLRYGTQQTEFFSFWTIFCPLSPLPHPFPLPPPLPPPPPTLATQKNQNSEKMKKHLEISSFYRSAAKIMIECYTIPEIWHVMDVIIFHSGLFFALLCS